MNKLARVIHAQATHQKPAQISALTRPEQTALADLQCLLQLSPRDLAARLTSEPLANDWWAPVPIVRGQP